MNIKNIKHIIIILKLENIFILIIKLKIYFRVLYIKIYFILIFTPKNKNHILAYFNMFAPCKCVQSWT